MERGKGMKLEQRFIVSTRREVVDFCCEPMEFAIHHEKIEWDLDGTFNIRDGAEIRYCPWCGRKVEPLETIKK